MKPVFLIRNITAQLLFLLDRGIGRYQKSSIVLCYHSFAQNSGRYGVQLTAFEKQIKKMLIHAKFVGLDQIINPKSRSGSVKSAQIMVTIDDGFESVLKILPITKKYNIPILLFVLENPDKANRQEIDSQEKFLTWDQIKYLHQHGWTIGCHSSTHPSFSALDKKSMKREIISAKISLEQKLGFPITTFAYPKGFYNSQIEEAVKQAGYKYAFSIESGFVNSSSQKLKLPRTIIDSSHRLHEIPAILTPSWILARRLTNRFHLWERFMS